jgi:hypothetical protein
VTTPVVAWRRAHVSWDVLQVVTQIVPHLSGDRVPGMSDVAPRVLALHRLISDEEAARAIEHGKARRPPLFPVETALPATLSALEKGFSLSGRAFLEHCCRFLGIGPWDPDGMRRRFTVRALLSDLAWCLLDEDDEEGCVVTASLFARILTDDDRELLPMDFLQSITDKYVESTRYLLPLLSHYARTALESAATRESPDVFLFLRDGLCFWPAFLAMQKSEVHRPALRHLIYTRPLRQQRQTPLVTMGDGERCVVEALRPMERGTLLDVGLYGTLIQTLHDTGFLRCDNAVFFLGSKNPHIAGFMNQWKKPDGTLPSVTEIVAMIDTVECLMKPVQLVTKMDEPGGRVFLRLGDPISFLCAARFMRELYLHSGDLGVGAMNGWYLEEPIPAWKDASDFIARWNVPSCLPPSSFVVRQ